MALPTKKKVRKYSQDYLKFGFIACPTDERLPLCLLCNRTLCNDSFKPGRLASHLQSSHAEHVDKNLDFFENSKESFFKRKQTTLTSLRSVQTNKQRAGAAASYEISLLIARCGQAHTIGEDLVKPALSIFAKTVLGRHDDLSKEIHLSNNTVQRRIDEMASDVEDQLVSKLRSCEFSVQIDESTVNDSRALLLTFVRFIENDDFVEEMLFCKYLVTSTTASDIFKVFTEFFSDKAIPLTNITSCAADGAPAMMGRRSGFLQLLKREHPDILVVHCVIHRENLAVKNLSPELHEILNVVIKCINSIKANPKNERLFKEFCLNADEEFIRLLHHTQVRWLSKGRCLDRFFELLDSLLLFCGDIIDPLRHEDAKFLVGYLADIFGKLNHLNTSLQGRKLTLIDSKTKIMSFRTKIRLWRQQISRKDFTSFARLSQLQSRDSAVDVILRHLSQLDEDFEFRFADLEEMQFPDWLLQPFLADLENAPQDLCEELTEVQHDDSAKVIFKEKGQKFWLHDEISQRFPKLTSIARHQILPFPSSYLVECAFSVVADLLSKKRNRLDICERGDLRLKLTSLKPRIEELVKNKTSTVSSDV